MNDVAELKDITIGPIPCVFDDCQMMLDIKVRALPGREDNGIYTLSIEPEPNAMREAMVRHFTTVHPDDTVELDDGDRRVSDMTEKDWDEMFAGDDEVETGD